MSYKGQIVLSVKDNFTLPTEKELSALLRKLTSAWQFNVYLLGFLIVQRSSEEGISADRARHESSIYFTPWSDQGEQRVLLSANERAIDAMQMAISLMLEV